MFQPVINSTVGKHSPYLSAFHILVAISFTPKIPPSISGEIGSWETVFFQQPRIRSWCEKMKPARSRKSLSSRLLHHWFVFLPVLNPVLSLTCIRIFYQVYYKCLPSFPANPREEVGVHLTFGLVSSKKRIYISRGAEWGRLCHDQKTLNTLSASFFFPFAASDEMWDR